MKITAITENFNINYANNKLTISTSDYDVYIDICLKDSFVTLKNINYNIINDFDSEIEINRIKDSLEFILLLDDYESVNKYVLDCIEELEFIETKQTVH